MNSRQPTPHTYKLTLLLITLATLEKDHAGQQPKYARELE